MASTSTRHPLVEDYLVRLEAASASLPRARRRALMADTEAYLAQAAKPGASSTEVHAMLGALGKPEELVAQDRPPPAPAAPDGLENSAIVMLAFGGLFLGVGWLFGVYLLWRSCVWTLTDKLIGTLLWPGGLASAVLVAVAYLASDAAHGA